MIKRALYIGQYSEGTTSKRRADVLKLLLPGWDFRVIDTHIPFFETPFVFRSLGFRTKSGPLIDKTNEGIYGPDYFRTLGAYQFGWGALSRWVPEKHTTRTFEIPACGTALVSERNEEICSFFSEEEAILYSSPQEMIDKLKYFMVHPRELEEVTRKGYEKMASGQFSYETQLREILVKAGINAHQ